MAGTGETDTSTESRGAEASGRFAAGGAHTARNDGLSNVRSTDAGAHGVGDGAGAATHRIVVYTTDRCPYCMRAKRLLDSKGLAYEEINLGRDPDGRIELAGKTGMMTFPQVLIDDALVGGFEETAAAAATGKLDELLSA